MKKIIFRGRVCYISDNRVSRVEQKEGFRYYLIRQDESDHPMPATIENEVMFDLWGTIACEEEIVLETEFTPGKFMTEVSEDEANYISKAAQYNLTGNRIDETEAPLEE